MSDQKVADALSEIQEEEFKLAKKEDRQPRCVYCGEPLDFVKEVQDVCITWTWDRETKSYSKTEDDGSSYKPYCGKCEAHDWDFSNNEFIEY